MASQLRRILPSLPKNPFPQSVQAWEHDFKNKKPLRILDLHKSVFGSPLRVDILHRVVVWQRDALRQGTHSTKGISDVRGSTRKAFSQKGRGAARVGTIRAPQFRGGATVHGPKPRSHETSLQKKVVDMGLRVALSTKYAQNQLVIVSKVDLPTHKTRDLSHILKSNQWTSALIAIRGENHNLGIAASNIPGIKVIKVEDLDVYNVLLHKNLILDTESATYLQNKLQVA
ncbi:ribosomal protein L4 [Basidiobolus meristosporus CBS 931.73]|uniref:Large ribosomal subunit protein uL4m n=1 Tax=Basidiobolus meristosporus CBS 931.73 TaxID=1314790 RepID=A0A1Y1Z3F2_9FUNG|nr:ribosomal protein L4 [Basidiobolus meristosporus CBS 931.73]|eukprot:ORY04736.1 ribosomal protein L4 [Basidiobolus meristosporus CBS 931.73]